MAQGTCTVDGCERPVKARGWCKMHYTRWHVHGDPLVALRSHAPRGPACSVAECERRVEARGWCNLHYQRWLKHGDPLYTKCPGRRIDVKGYVLIWQPDYPLATKIGYVAEHRMVAWDAGILIDPADDVHHRNDDKTDNRPENLAAMSHAEHRRLHNNARV